MRRSERGGMRAILLWALVFACLAGSGLFHTHLKVRAVSLAYDLSEATARHRRLLERRAALRLEVATLESPQRIERIARERLGMRPPAPGQIVVVPERPPKQAEDPRPQTAEGTAPEESAGLIHVFASVRNDG